MNPIAWFKPQPLDKSRLNSTIPTDVCGREIKKIYTEVKVDCVGRYERAGNLLK